MSAAERQAEAHKDVERIADEFQMACRRRYGYRAEVAVRPIVEELLRRDVIRVGTRPAVTAPMSGQTTIEDAAELSARQAALT